MLSALSWTWVLSTVHLLWLHQETLWQVNGYIRVTRNDRCDSSHFFFLHLPKDVRGLVGRVVMLLVRNTSSRAMARHLEEGELQVGRGGDGRSGAWGCADGERFTKGAEWPSGGLGVMEALGHP